VIPLLADEHFPHEIVTQTRAWSAEVDFLTVQDVGLDGMPDPNLLEWAWEHGRVIVSYDVNTLIGFAYQRIRAAKPMAGLVIGFRHIAVGDVVRDLAIISVCGFPSDLKNQVLFLPV
jgi:hypothetical protein